MVVVLPRMTKKKSNRQKHQKDVGDTSEEELKVPFLGKVCSHVPRAVNFGRVKKLLKAGNLSTCSNCSSSPADEAEDAEVWLCLQCGYLGCGRMSTNKHMLQHFKTIHSDCHSLVLSPSSGVVWCYDCDDEVQLQSSRNLTQCVEFIMKMKVNNNVPTENNKTTAEKKPSVQLSLIETVLKEPANVSNEVDAVTPKKTESKSDSKVKKVPTKVSVKGLKNLGNTCFFNAVMQNLSQTNLLFQGLEDSCSSEVKWEVPQLMVAGDSVVEDSNSDSLKLDLPREFQLVNSFLKFLKQMSASSQNKTTDIVNPTDLFNEIQRKSPQFQHFHQQDSHELLRQFLDGIRQEEVKRQKKAILKHFNIGNANTEIGDDVRKLIKAYGCYASHTIVEKVFGGLLISTVLCEECKMSSQVFEPFMDMSLPLFEEKQQESCDQVCPLLDGGKQEDVKAGRIRKSGYELDENEFVLNKSKKDYGKPSKHQEKKMKMLEKKEKKKNKKALNKKTVSEVSETPVEDESLKPVNVTIDQETGEQNRICVEPGETDQMSDSDLEVDENESTSFQDDRGNGVMESNGTDCPGTELQEIRLDSNSERDVASLNEEDIETRRQRRDKREEDVVMECNETDCSGLELKEIKLENNSERDVVFPKEDDIDIRRQRRSEDIVMECYKTDCSGLELNGIRVENNSEIDMVSLKEENIGIQRSRRERSEDIESLVLFDEVIVFNKVSVEPSSPSTEKVLKLSNKEHPDPQKCAVEDSPSVEATVTDLSERLEESVQLSPLDPLELERRMYALSMQVREVRIRRDSDRQESILSSSSGTDGGDSPQTNYTSDDSPDNQNSTEQDENWSHNLSENQTKEWILKSLTTLKPRRQASPLECSVTTCLAHFTKPELLAGNNKFRCENCSEIKRRKSGDKKAVVYSNARKQLLVFSPPAVLTLHLKRFQQVGMSLRKVNRFVEFPLLLDLAPYCSSACLILPHMASVKDEIMYSLYGIVEHSGRLTSGHYTAYVKISKRTLHQEFMNDLPLAQCDLEQLLHKFSKFTTPQSSRSSEEEDASEERRWYYISDGLVRESSETQVLKCQAYLLFYERIK